MNILLLGYGRQGKKIDETLKAMRIPLTIASGRCELTDLEGFTHVIVATPPETHHRIAAKLLDRSAPPAIFLEKPFATSLPDAHHLFRLVKSHGANPRVLVNYTWTFHPAVRELEADKPYAASILVGSNRRHTTAPDLYEWGPHAVSLMRILDRRPRLSPTDLDQLYAATLDEWPKIPWTFSGAIGVAFGTLPVPDERVARIYTMHLPAAEGLPIRSAEFNLYKPRVETLKLALEEFLAEAPLHRDYVSLSLDVHTLLDAFARRPYSEKPSPFQV